MFERGGVFGSGRTVDVLGKRWFGGHACLSQLQPCAGNELGVNLAARAYEPDGGLA